MDNCDVIDIGLRGIKCCGMYSKEYKNWIARENDTPAIVKTINSFKEYWANAIALVNQMAVPASQHGYGMAAMDDNASLALYNESLANFGAAYAATQESIKIQVTSLASMQGQPTNIQQFCMNVGQQPPPNIYAPTQQQHTSNNRFGRRNGGGSGRGSGSGNFPQQPTWFGGSGAGAQQPTCPPNPYKHWENWNYCLTHGSDVEDWHMSATCGYRCPAHNPNTTHSNIMGGSVAGMHKTILPSARGCTPPPSHRPQQQQRPQQCPPGSYYPTQGTTAPPTQFGGMQPAGGTYHQWRTMTMPVHQPGQTMMNFVGQQYPPNAMTAPMMQQPAQHAMPMMAPYYAPNQQPYNATNQQQPGYF
jgi:hypothetical protein